METGIARAAAIGAEQLRRIIAGDFDGYAALLDAYEAACFALTSAAGDVAPAQRREIDELVELDREIAVQLQLAKDELAARMAAMRSTRRASGAYLAHVGVVRTPLGEA